MTLYDLKMHLGFLRQNANECHYQKSLFAKESTHLRTKEGDIKWYRYQHPKRVTHLNMRLQCLYNTPYSRMSKKNATKRILRSQGGTSDNDNSYRPCSVWIWLDTSPRMPPWWVDQIAQKNPTDNQYAVRCPGMNCEKTKRVPKLGNKNCTNGGLCKICCDDYQIKGFLPSCGYAPHNYAKKLGEVGLPSIQIR